MESEVCTKKALDMTDQIPVQGYEGSCQLLVIGGLDYPEADDPRCTGGNCLPKIITF